MKVIDNFDFDYIELDEVSLESLYKLTQIEYSDFGLEGLDIEDKAKKAWEWLKQIIKNLWNYIKNSFLSLNNRSKKFWDKIDDQMSKFKNVAVGETIDVEEIVEKIEDSLYWMENGASILDNWLKEMENVKFTPTDYINKFDNLIKSHSERKYSKGANSWSPKEIYDFMVFVKNQNQKAIQKLNPIYDRIHKMYIRIAEDKMGEIFEPDRIHVMGKTYNKISGYYNVIVKINKRLEELLKKMAKAGIDTAKAANAKDVTNSSMDNVKSRDLTVAKEDVNVQIVQAIMDSYGIEGVTRIINKLASEWECD